MKKNEFDSVYNIEVQRILLSFLIEDVDVFIRCRNIIKDTYFDDQLRRTVRFILGHADEHKAIPNPVLIQAKTGIEVQTLTQMNQPMDQDWFLEEITKFCRYKEFESIIFDSYDLLQKGEEANIETRAREAMQISLVSDLGLDYFDDPKARLQGMLDTPNLISTGYNVIDDKLFGGFEIGGLNIFFGILNSGKSLILQNLALNWALMCYNVIYFTLEMSKESISVRIDAMITGKSTKEVFQNIDDTALMVSIKGKKAGRLQFAKMKESGTDVNDLKSYLKEFQIKTGLKPDAIVIDYLDIMHPTNKAIDVSNVSIKDKYISEEVRGLMSETNTFGATASQINRGGTDANGEFNYTHIAGGLTKAMTCDNAFFIHSPPAMKENGFYELLFGKTRTSAAVGQRVKLNYDPVCMRITDDKVVDIEKPSTLAELKTLYQLTGAAAPEVVPKEEVTAVDLLEAITEGTLLERLAAKRDKNL
jgi:KaiC/GvpD/RAD55 family RecA-like ATPase